MKKTPINFRGRLMLFTACTVAASLAGAGAVLAQTTTSSQVVIPDNGNAGGQGSYQIEKVKIQYKKLLLREKDIPNAISTLTEKDVQKTNPTTGSIQTLLQLTPNVVAYSQQPGQDETTLAIRGVRNDELAETLDGIPINSLLEAGGADGSGGYLSAPGSPVTLNEISGATVYPGIAPPDHQGFGTVGGTIAYTTKQPTDDRYEEIEGGLGSFDTQHFGFTLNTGDIGSGPDAAKAIMVYDQSQTAGYVSNTPAQFHDFMFNLEKPYDNGLSKVGLVVIFNQGKALVQTTPSPIPLIQSGGYKFNFPISQGFFNSASQNLTTILSDETYINKYAIFDASLFLRHSTDTSDNYQSAANAEGAASNLPGQPFVYSANVQGLYQFFGCFGPGTPFESPGYFTYDPAATFGSCAAGESDEYSQGHSNIVGVTPKLTLFPDDHNTIVIGGLLAKANSGGESYLYGGDAAEENQDNGYNSFALGNGAQRTIFSGYIQDTYRGFDKKLQLTGGLKVDAAYSSTNQIETDGIYNPAKLQNFTKIGGYYFGGAYNLPDNFVLFGSLGKDSLFAPLSDYSLGTTPTGLSGGTNTPTPEIVHLFEGGIRYDTPRLLLSADYYYQNISDGFAFFENFLTNQEYYANNGGQLFRGVEGSGKFLITPELSIFANGSYDKTEYTKSYFASDTLTEDQFGYAYTGTPLSNVPQWTGTIGLDYDSGPYSASVTGLYTGREFLTEDINVPNTANPPGYQYGGTDSTTGVSYGSNALNGATVTNTKIENPANFVVNVLLSYKIPVPKTFLQSLTLSLNIQNLLDERYYNYAFQSEDPEAGLYLPGTGFNSGFVGQPRSYFLDAVARF
jgi:iron complex outermembrane receptor protein